VGISTLLHLENLANLEELQKSDLIKQKRWLKLSSMILCMHFIDEQYLCAMLSLTDVYLNKVENIIDVIDAFAIEREVEQLPEFTGNDQLTVGQKVLAKSAINGGRWCSALVINGQR